MNNDKKGRYKYCIVPKCKNSSVNAPDKIFISLPSNLKSRKLWQRAMRRADFVSVKGTHFCCEDHFNVEKDLENYMYIKTMKVGKIILKPGVIPHIFDCQIDTPTAHTSKAPPFVQEKEKQILLNTCNEDIAESQSMSDEAGTQEKTFDVGIQVNKHVFRRSKATQTVNIIRHRKRNRSKEVENTESIGKNYD
ncbi:uncharacterized protein [Leptinotarsa decemlineata]|uniref:uncharacterized protein n=1 Tax=Leptinotarsa decemlineata TaxID=7539 RepID=UPI003D306119